MMMRPTEKWRSLDWVIGDRLTFAECSNLPAPLRFLHPRHYRQIEKKTREWLAIPPAKALRFTLQEEGSDYFILAVEQDPAVAIKVSARGPKEHDFYKRLEGGLAQQRLEDVSFNFQLVLNCALHPDASQAGNHIRDESMDFFERHPNLGSFGSKVRATMDSRSHAMMLG